jgi:hypothetical protein
MTRLMTFFSRTTGWAEVLGATLMLLGAAFYNGYPLVYSDTGTYITTGMEWKVPDDRPIVYGLFLFFTSLRLSLWLPVAVQSLLLSGLLRRVLHLVLADRYEPRIFLGITAVLCLLTPLPWYAGQLMPDVFTPIQVLLVGVVLLQPRIHLLRWVAYGALYMLCCTGHFSNLFIGLVTWVLVWLAHYFSAKKTFDTAFLLRRGAVIGLWSVLAFFTLPVINYALEQKFILSKAGNVFLLARFIDDGLLKQYLDDHCATEPSPLCAYKDSLPANSREWHWDQKSPLYRLGGWGASEEVYCGVIKGMLTSPKYLGLLAWKSLTRTPAQLLQNAVGSGLDYKWYRSPESPPYQAVQRFFPHEFPEYRYARQNGNLWKQELDLAFFNDLQFYVLCITLLYLLWTWNGAWPETLLQVRWVLLAGVVANAFVTANLASICDRFPSRMVWMLPLLALIQAVLQYKRR